MPRIEIMSHRGDDLFAEWSRETTPADLKAISERFQEQRAKGFSVFTAQTGNRVDEFTTDIQEDIIFIAPLIGG